MKISILTPDLSHNCLGRAYLLAKVLKRRYDTEIIGPAFRNKIWEPLSNQSEITIKVVKPYSPFYKTFLLIKSIQREITGDVIYVSKPLLVNYGAGLLERKINKKPLILDIDDWQMGFQEGLTIGGKLDRFIFSCLQFNSPASYWNSLIGEKLIRFADEITVSNNFLKSKYGGTVVWHARDTNVFNPAKFNREFLRKKYKLSVNKKVVSFIGTPQPYKGVEDLIYAISLIKDPRIYLILIGLNHNKYNDKLRKIVKEKIGHSRSKLLGAQSFAELPEFLAMTDIIVIPQHRTNTTLGQIPAKVFDAMAMAKPVIATAASSLPEILDNCGWIVEPEKPEQLARTIQYIISHPFKAEKMGQMARERCKKKYSFDAMEKILTEVFKKYE